MAGARGATRQELWRATHAVPSPQGSSTTLLWATSQRSSSPTADSKVAASASRIAAIVAMR